MAHDDAILRLGLQAFYRVLSHGSLKYAFIVRWLEVEIMSRKYKRCRREFKSLVEEGQAGLAQIST